MLSHIRRLADTLLVNKGLKARAFIKDERQNKSFPEWSLSMKHTHCHQPPRGSRLCSRSTTPEKPHWEPAQALSRRGAQSRSSSRQRGRGSSSVGLRAPFPPSSPLLSPWDAIDFQRSYSEAMVSGIPCHRLCQNVLRRAPRAWTT